MLTSLAGGVVVDAAEVSRGDGPFLCPECKSELTLKKGPVNIHHFAHCPPFDCDWGCGELFVHHECKREIYNALLRKKLDDAALERSLASGSRPDVSFSIRGHLVAIEVQRSTLSEWEIEQRTFRYYKAKVSVLWVIPGKFPNVERYAPKAFEKYLHGLYFGKCFYHSHDDKVVPCHFGDFQIYVEPREWYEDGEEQTAGGYYRYSKRYRTPIISNAVAIPNMY